MLMSGFLICPQDLLTWAVADVEGCSSVHSEMFISLCSRKVPNRVCDSAGGASAATMDESEAGRSATRIDLGVEN